MQRLTNKVALVTGAASGIGRAMVEAYVREGAQVLACDIQDDKGADLAAQHGGQVRYQRCDVTDVAAIAAAVEGAVSAFGGLDIMVNNAGAGGASAMVEDIERGPFDFTMNLLVRSVVFGTKYATPHLRARGGGVVINTASAAAFLVGGTPFAYTMAKAAVVHFTRAAAIELAVHKIRVNALAPGVIATPIWAQLRHDENAGEQMAALMAQVGAGMQPLPKAGLPADIADAAVFLASAESAFITGQALVVDGGITLGQRARTAIAMPMALGMGEAEAEKAYRDALAAENERWG